METNVENTEMLYTPKQASKITGIESTLLLKWVNYFNIETEWTQEGHQGHRRYTKENIEEILQLKKLIQEKKMNWDQAKTIFDGKEPQFIVDEGKTRLEKSVEEMRESQKELLENQKEQREFNKSLLEQLKTMNELYQNTLNELAATKNQLAAANQEILSIKEGQKLLGDTSNKDEWITRNRITMKLRSEARKLWDEKPEAERMIKTGLFRKEEDKSKRDDFIQDYIDSNIVAKYEEEIKRT